jgi:hypothetical protein
MKSVIHEILLPYTMVLKNRRILLFLVFCALIRGLYAQTEFPAGDYWSFDAALKKQFPNCEMVLAYNPGKNNKNSVPIRLNSHRRDSSWQYAA